MPTYVYETIPGSQGGEPRRYEFKQSIKDPAFVRHPATGEPIKRIIAGGVSVLGSAQGRHTHTPSCGCGAGGCRG